MKLYLFRLLFSLIKFFHLERKIPQLRQMDSSQLLENRMYYHYGRIVMSCRNPKRHYFTYNVSKGGESYETTSAAEAEVAKMNGAIIDERHYNTPCNMCEIKSNGLPCCVCNMDVYFRVVDEFRQHGCNQ